MVFADFQTLAELRKTKIGLFEAEESTVSVEKIFNVYSIILVFTKMYIFALYFTTVLLLIILSQPSSIGWTVWTVTSTAAFSHCWSYMEHSDLWIRCVIYISCFLMRYANLFDFWFDKYSPWDWDQIGIRLGAKHMKI